MNNEDKKQNSENPSDKKYLFEERFCLTCLKNCLNKNLCLMKWLMGTVFVTIIGLIVVCGFLLYGLLKEIKDNQNKSLPVDTPSSVNQSIKECVQIHDSKLNYSVSGAGGSQNGLFYLTGFVVLIIFFIILTGIVCISSYRKSLIQLYLEDKDMELQFAKEVTKRKAGK